MNEAGFKTWLQANYKPNTVTTKISEARKLAKFYGSLDDLYDADQLESLKQELAYSAADQRAGRPNPSRLEMLSDIQRDLSNYRTTLNYYCNFREGKSRKARSGKPDRAAVERAMAVHDEMGLPAFLDAYDFGTNVRYWIDEKGLRYPAKAVFGVAHDFMPDGMVLDSDKFNSTDAWKHLAGLGFFILSDGEKDDDGEENIEETRLTAAPIVPVNLILYGPPGTGKTYASVAHAVRLCDGLASDDPLLAEQNRKALKARYDDLVKALRIDFVTFHQSYSYEEFVEGLRPVQATSGEGNGAGFSLAPEDGIFRRIANRAALSRSSGGHFVIGNRNIFKMSLGNVNLPEEAFLFDEAIREGHVTIGFDDIDWTDARFERRDEIIKACQHEHQTRPRPDRPEPTALTGRVQCPMIFRNIMKRGDLVVVAMGKYRFRAIGEVTGDYEYVPRGTGEYSHRRKVKWLWIDKAGAPVDEIYGKDFVQGTIYLPDRDELNIPALETYINGQIAGTGQPEPYVLIIDEINRGNISRIFGELITLIEPDKRAGQDNALEVRLPYSKLPFSVPSNLHIIGTMNTADRSIAQLDTALRRRFTFREIEPDAELLETVAGVPLNLVLKAMNDRIEYLVDREHRIGHAFFKHCSTLQDIHAVMRDKVIPLLQDYFFEDWGRVASVLNEKPGQGGAFLTCRTLKPPLGHTGEDRESWTVNKKFSDDVYAQLIGATAVQDVEA